MAHCNTEGCDNEHGIVEGTCPECDLIELLNSAATDPKMHKRMVEALVGEPEETHVGVVAYRAPFVWDHRAGHHYFDVIVLPTDGEKSIKFRLSRRTSKEKPTECPKLGDRFEITIREAR